MSIIELSVVVSSAILFVLILAFLSIFYMVKQAKKELSNITLNLIEDVLTQIQTDKAYQEKVFYVGAVLGKGIRYGFGDIIGGKKGKFSLNDVLGTIAQNVVPNLLGKLGGQEGSPSPSNNSPNLSQNNNLGIE